tara:strand:+ start:6622 stop:7629 length:1008 start_codon:yes stop_codon:yes gene_type:complete
MKAAVIRLPATLESLAIEERPDPTLAPGLVKVAWRALSLNFHDLVIATGMLPTVDGRIPVSDGAGEIVEVGEGVAEYQIGDRVMSTFFPDWADGDPDAQNTARLAGDSTDGCGCEFSVVSPETLTRVPRGYSFAEAATLPCAALTAWRALVDVAQLKSGQTVLVQGSGGVSVFALQLAKAMGARVLATSSTPEKCERLRALGADAVCNYRETPDWGQWAADQSGGGVDVLVDVGGPATLPQSLLAARVNAQIVCVGLLGGMDVSLSVPLMLLKQQQIRPIAVGNHVSQKALVAFLDDTELRPIIDRSFRLDQIVDALRYQSSGKHFGKIVINLQE